jgi:hypothetical protein
MRSVGSLGASEAFIAKLLVLLQATRATQICSVRQHVRQPLAAFGRVLQRMHPTSALLLRVTPKRGEPHRLCAYNQPLSLRTVSMDCDGQAGTLSWAPTFCGSRQQVFMVWPAVGTACMVWPAVEAAYVLYPPVSEQTEPHR